MVKACRSTFTICLLASSQGHSNEAALRHSTRDGAYATFDEQIRGTLAPGKLADPVVLSRDILIEPPESMLKAKVLLTVMSGKDTYRQGRMPCYFEIETPRAVRRRLTGSSDLTGSTARDRCAPEETGERLGIRRSWRPNIYFALTLGASHLCPSRKECYTRGG